MGRFLTALANEFRALNVTTIYTAETRNIIGAEIDYPAINLSAFADNLILLRYVEIGSQLLRLLSAVKMRNSDFDPSLRSFRITPAGIELGDRFARADRALSGFPQVAAQELFGEQSAHGG